jgi:hypothetical protein
MDDERQRVTVVLDRDIAEAVERQARAERGSMSGVCRRVLSEWAAGSQDSSIDPGTDTVINNACGCGEPRQPARNFICGHYQGSVGRRSQQVGRQCRDRLDDKHGSYPQSGSNRRR